MPANSLLLKQTLLSRPLVCVTDTPPLFFTAGRVAFAVWPGGRGGGGGSRFESLAV